VHGTSVHPENDFFFESFKKMGVLPTSPSCQTVLQTEADTRRHELVPTVPTLSTADTHFGHGGALGLFRRPFASVAVMDDTLVEVSLTISPVRDEAGRIVGASKIARNISGNSGQPAPAPVAGAKLYL
jgi:hypothetical protein